MKRWPNFCECFISTWKFSILRRMIKQTAKTGPLWTRRRNVSKHTSSKRELFTWGLYLWSHFWVYWIKQKLIWHAVLFCRFVTGVYEYDASFHSFVFECCEDLLPESNESNELDSTNEVILVKLKCLCTLLTSYIKMNNGELAEMNVSTLFCRTSIPHWLNLLTYGKQTENVFFEIGCCSHHWETAKDMAPGQHGTMEFANTRCRMEGTRCLQRSGHNTR